MKGVIIKEIVLAEDDRGRQPTPQLMTGIEHERMVMLAADFLGATIMNRAERIVFEPKDKSRYYVIKDRQGVTGWIGGERK